VYHFVIDTETTANGYEGSPKAFYDNNRILVSAIYHGGAYISEGTLIDYMMVEPEQCLLIGHNLQFDIEHLMKLYPSAPWHKVSYWSTDIVHYLHSGHTAMFPSLEESCAFYGVPYTKRLDLKAHLKGGGSMEDIPPQDLQLYCNEDTYATYELYLAQRECIDEVSDKLTQLVIDQSGCIPYLASMGLNGFGFDVDKAAAELLKKEAEIKVVLGHLKEEVKLRYPGQAHLVDKLNVTAARTASAFLFGYPEKIKTNKSKKKEEFFVFDNPVLAPDSGAVKNESLGYSVAEDVLAWCAPEHSYAGLLKEYRDLNKVINTYLGPLISRANFTPANNITASIHSTSTATGRTSCTDPNFQNMPPFIRGMFRETFHIYEIDFKQLEVHAIAELSGDKQLIADLNNGEDIHYLTGTVAFGWKDPSEMTDSSRRTIKSVVFGLCYGGSAATLAEQSGISKEMAFGIIEAFYKRYVGVKRWHEDIVVDAKINERQTKEVRPDGTMVRNTEIETDITGRLHVIKESPSPDWLVKRTGKKWSITPTKVKNYKPQGFAGGDIVKTFSRVLFYLMGGHDNKYDFKYHNTVHDSLVISINNEYKELFESNVVKAIRYTEKYYDLKTKLNVNVKSDGNYWR
jgi:hypothetical protein